MTIWLLEDIPLQAEQIMKALRDNFKDDKVRWLKSEFEFRRNIDEIASKDSAAVVLDMMVPWDVVGGNSDPPDEVFEQGHQTAGLRCQRLLFKANPHLPVIFYTVIHEEEMRDSGLLQVLPANVKFLEKESNLTPLVKMIQSVIPQ
jgi:hypothetical protein